MEFKPITSVFLHVTNSCNCRCRYCAPAGTKILLPDFTEKNIEDIQVGDEVLSTEEYVKKNQSRTLKVSKVEQLFQRQTDKLLKITMEDDTVIYLTENHPVLTVSKTTSNAWCQAKNILYRKSNILGVKDNDFTLHKIKNIERLTGDFTVYNFETTEHTYIANSIVVHNCFETARPDYITWQTAKDTVDYLIKNAEATGDTPSINFFGGEPMLCWDSIIVPLVKYIKENYKKPFQLSMTSNCTLMNKERLDFMKENNIGLLFSIDGDKETQNYNRPMKNGSGSWEHIKDIIALIPKYYPQMTFRSTVIPETCHNVFHNIMFAEKNGYNNFFVVPNVLQEWPEDKKEVLKSEMRKYSDYFIACFRNGKMPIRFSEYDRSFQKIPKINQAIANDEMPTEEKHGACAKCGLGTNRFAAVGPNGDIYGCQELVSTDTSADIFKIGNIYTGIDEARRERLAASYKACTKHGNNCKDCRLYRVCDGGCVANNYFATGDINTVAPVYCWWIQVLLEEAIYVCNEMGENPPELFVKYWKECWRGR